MAATDSQIALTMTFTLRPPFKTHFLLLKDYVADVRIPARDRMLTTIIAKNIPLSPALEQLKTIFDDVQNPVYWRLHDQKIRSGPSTPLTAATFCWARSASLCVSLPSRVPTKAGWLNTC